MSKLRMIPAGMAWGLLFIANGCVKETPISPPYGGPTNDKEAIIQIAGEDSLGEISTSDELAIDDGAPRGDNAGLEKEATSIRPIRWGRKIENITRHVDVDFFGDTIAIATITKNIGGHLLIAAAYQDTGRLADTIIAKPFREIVRHKIRFRRIARTEFYIRNWIPVAITLVEGDTQPENINLFTIKSIEYSFPWATDTITDPLNSWLRFSRVLNGIPVLRVGDSVRVVLRVSSTDSDTEHAVLRYRVNALPVLGVRRVRMKLVESLWNGSAYDRTYKATFYGTLGNLMAIGRFNAVVDVMSHGSLYDDTKPFSNRFWGLPYFVIWRY